MTDADMEKYNHYYDKMLNKIKDKTITELQVMLQKLENDKYRVMAGQSAIEEVIRARTTNRNIN